MKIPAASTGLTAAALMAVLGAGSLGMWREPASASPNPPPLGTWSDPPARAAAMPPQAAVAAQAVTPARTAPAPEAATEAEPPRVRHRHVRRAGIRHARPARAFAKATVPAPSIPLSAFRTATGPATDPRLD